MHISRLDAGVYAVGITSLKDNALLELCGSKEEGLPFLRPHVAMDGRRLSLADMQWERLDGWLPRFHCQVEGLEISGTIFAPLDEKGFVYLLEASSERSCELGLGVEGWWKSLDLVVKALSWALRELVVHDPLAVRVFLDGNEAVLAGRVKREVCNKLRTGLKNPNRIAG